MGYSKRLTAEERFWAKVQKSDACWEWMAYRNPAGYGKFGPTRQAIVLAHRFSYELTRGPIPDGLFVCHACDNPACVRPDHLWLGTNKENLQDASRKGRMTGAPKRGLFCRHGHEQTEKNKRIWPGGQIQCEQCRRVWNDRRNEKRKLQRKARRS